MSNTDDAREGHGGDVPHRFAVEALEDGIEVEGYRDGELVVKGRSNGPAGLAQMEKLYDMWSSEVWRAIHE